MTFRLAGWLVVTIGFCSIASNATAETRIRIMPADGAVLAVGQLFDIRVEATSDGAEPPARLQVSINGRDVTSRSVLAAGAGGERGAGGTGTPPTVTSTGDRAGNAAPNTTNFLLRRFSVNTAGAGGHRGAHRGRRQRAGPADDRAMGRSGGVEAGAQRHSPARRWNERGAPDRGADRVQGAEEW